MLERNRNYDDFFKVNGKSSSVRWNTFSCNQNGDRIDAVIVEEFRINRADKSKNNYFLLEKHFTLNKDYEIVSLWDKQLEASRVEWVE